VHYQLLIVVNKYPQDSGYSQENHIPLKVCDLNGLVNLNLDLKQLQQSLGVFLGRNFHDKSQGIHNLIPARILVVNFVLKDEP
jgi:hypothetical protein